MKTSIIRILAVVAAFVSVVGILTAASDGSITTNNLYVNNINGVVQVDNSNTNGFINAINLCNENCTIIVPEGNYVVNSVYVRDGQQITINCVSHASKLIASASAGNDGMFFVEDGTLIINNCFLDGSAMIVGTTPHCLNGRNYLNGTIIAENNYITGCTYDGIYTKNCRIIAKNNEIYNTGRQGIAIVGGTNHFIDSNYIHKVANSLINMENVGAYVVNDTVITNNILEWGSAGIGTGTGGGARNRITISNNIIKNTSSHGIYLYNVTNGCTINGNQLNDVAGDSIYLYYGEGCVVGNNIVIDSAGNDGITARECNNVAITGNVVKNVDNSGIYLWSNTANSTVIGNTVIDTDGYGIISNGKYNLVANNIINGVANAEYGVYLLESANYNTVANNIIYDDGDMTNGVKVHSSVTDGYIYGNQIYGSSGDNIAHSFTTYEILANTDTDNILLNELYAAGIGGDGAGKAICVKADGYLGTCTDVVGVGGTCTCA